MTSYSTNKPAVRDSFDDDDISDDVDDEVFIRDGKSGFKVDEERGVKRPLMAPRRKVKISAGSQLHPEICKQPQCRAFCVPFCFSLLAVVGFIGLLFLVVVFINMFPFSMDKIRLWSKNIASHEKLILPCSDLKTHDVWAKSFPKLTAEAALKLSDVNGDGIQDIMVGYGTGADEIGMGQVVCESYMPGTVPCLGGVMALDGRSGSVLWQHWTHHIVLAVDCSTDTNNDNTNDCIVSGKGGVLSALNGRNGNVLWELKYPPKKEEVDVYAVQFINDVDFDLVPDVLASHSSIQAGQVQGHLLILSGKTGSVLSQVPIPNYESIFVQPQILVRPDGTSVLLYATGSVDSQGGLYAVPLHHLVKGNISQSIQLIKGGVNDAPVLVDINRDRIEDIIVISGDRITAIDGMTFDPIWNTSSASIFGRLQLLSSPTVAYFNNDDIPDFLFTHMVGTSYPEYYFSQTSVVEGRTGLALMEKVMTSSAFVDTPGLSLSLSGDGNDFFLYWVAVCQGHEEVQQRFSFLNSTPIKQRAQADLCKLRFNATLDLRLYAFSQLTAPPGLLLYSSEKRWESDHNGTWNTVSDDSSTAGEKNKWPPQPQPLNNFHHTGDSVEHLKATPHRSHNSFHRQQFSSNTEQLPSSLDNYERMQQGHPELEWRPQEAAYGNNPAFQNRRYSNLGMYGNILSEGLPDLDSEFGQEGEEGPMIPPNSLGRDERDDDLGRQKRSVPTRGLPHVGSPGTLVSSLDGSSVDVVLTTHWLPAARDVYVRLPRDEQCVQDKIARISTEKYDDLETLRATIEEECFMQRGVLRSSDSEAVSHSHLTVSRLSLLCTCDIVSTAMETCASVLPFTRQSWPQRGPGVFFKPRKPTRPVTV